MFSHYAEGSRERVKAKRSGIALRGGRPAPPHWPGGCG